MKEEIPEVECSSNRCPQDGAIRFLIKEASNSFSQPTDHTGFGFNSYVII